MSCAAVEQGFLGVQCSLTSATGDAGGSGGSGRGAGLDGAAGAESLGGGKRCARRTDRIKPERLPSCFPSSHSCLLPFPVASASYSTPSHDRASPQCSLPSTSPRSRSPWWRRSRSSPPAAPPRTGVSLQHFTLPPSSPMTDHWLLTAVYAALLRRYDLDHHGLVHNRAFVDAALALEPHESKSPPPPTALRQPSTDGSCYSWSQPRSSRS